MGKKFVTEHIRWNKCVLPWKNSFHKLPWKDTQYRQKNTSRTSNFWHTHLCQSYDTNQQVLGEIALRSPSYVALSPVAADARYQELSDRFLPFLLGNYSLTAV